MAAISERPAGISRLRKIAVTIAAPGNKNKTSSAAQSSGIKRAGNARPLFHESEFLQLRRGKRLIELRLLKRRFHLSIVQRHAVGRIDKRECLPELLSLQAGIGF